MNREKWLLTVLTIHLSGLILMAGTTIVDYITYKLFWRIYLTEKKTSNGILKLMSRFSRIAGIGAALLILSGFGMMFITHGVFGEQIWFRIKFALVILLIANSLFIGRRLGVKQRNIFSAPVDSISPPLLKIRSSLSRFYLIQFFLFIGIIILSVFKFN